MEKTRVSLLLLAAIGIAGGIVAKGQVVEVSEDEAKNLLNRGKAELATEKNVQAAQTDAAELRAMLANDMTAEQFAALSPTKQKALTKAAAEAIEKEKA